MLIIGFLTALMVDSPLRAQHHAQQTVDRDRAAHGQSVDSSAGGLTR